MDKNIYLLIWWIVVITFNNSDRISAVNVIVTILTKDC